MQHKSATTPNSNNITWRVRRLEPRHREKDKERSEATDLARRGDMVGRAELGG